jgi:hypothetical protein
MKAMSWRCMHVVRTLVIQVSNTYCVACGPGSCKSFLQLVGSQQIWHILTRGPRSTWALRTCVNVRWYIFQFSEKHISQSWGTETQFSLQSADQKRPWTCTFEKFYLPIYWVHVRIPKYSCTLTGLLISCLPLLFENRPALSWNSILLVNTWERYWPTMHVHEQQKRNQVMGSCLE